MASKIEDYGMIGNTITCALVSRSGSIDWFCAPRFDSDACFTALVGYDEHGRWSLRPAARVRETRQRYRGDSMVLETEFVCDGGVVRIVDFMPMDGRCSVVRIVEGVEGEVPVEMLLDVRFGYGADIPLIEMTRDGTRFLAGPDALILRGPLTLQQQGPRVSAELQVRKGDRIPMQLTWYPSHEQPPAGADVSQALSATDAFWRDWAGRCTYQGRWRDAVVRSLLTLKAMTYAPTGGIVAAPTTSLPEADRRRAQLGLSLLLAARRQPDAGRAADRRLRRRGARRFATGWCAPPRARRRSCRSCTASMGSVA